MKSKGYTIIVLAVVILGFGAFWINDLVTRPQDLPNIGGDQGLNTAPEQDINRGEQDTNTQGQDKDTRTQDKEPGADNSNNPGSTNTLVRNTGVFPGDQAPDFWLMDMEGNEHTLEDYRGKPVIINFWASWCPSCREEMADFQRFYERYKDDVVLLTINVGEVFDERNMEKKVEQDIAIIKDYFNKNNLDLPVLLDSYGRASNLYRVRTIPTTYIINKDGIITNFYLMPVSFEELEEEIERME